MRCLLLSAALAAASAQNVVFPTFWDSGIGATFDVSGLTQSAAAFAWRDPNDLYTSNSTYTFNVGANVPASLVPAGCNTNKKSPAWQVDDSGSCYALGADLSSYGRPQIQADFLDPLDYARGVKFTFLGGDVTGGCPATVNGGARAFSLAFMCADRPFPAPTAPQVDLSDAFIDEVDTCIYVAYSRSQFGCPRECPIVNGRLCSGNGVCGYDTTLGSARCFCYDNYIDAGCATEQYPFPSGSVAGAVFGGILVGTVSVLGYAYWQGKKAAKASPQIEGFY